MIIKYSVVVSPSLKANQRQVTTTMPESTKMKKPDVKIVILGDMNVGKTSLLHRYTERKFKDTISTVGGAFFLKQWGPYNISIWDTAGREQFHGLGSMYCRGAAAVILTYDVTNWQSLAELEDRFLSLTDTASTDCIFAIVGNKADLTDPHAQAATSGGGQADAELGGVQTQPLPACPTPPASPLLNKQVSKEDAMALYGRVLRYKGLEEKTSPPAEKMCFETSAKTGYNVDMLFETLFDMVLPSILKKRREGENSTVDLEESRGSKRTKAGCCA
ncbi:ras-related protein Rab-20 [Chanos chanos]|uniref:Ras-related protein Rab-20 n=1 Tax=Chanos chanos TaxID=29144 RepID=A0A6J2WH46_CHACN|nr:ras-related protein Rab-20-like [Chanos chanos]